MGKGHERVMVQLAGKHMGRKPLSVGWLVTELLPCKPASVKSTSNLLPRRPSRPHSTDHSIHPGQRPPPVLRKIVMSMLGVVVKPVRHQETNRLMPRQTRIGSPIHDAWQGTPYGRIPNTEYPGEYSHYGEKGERRIPRRRVVSPPRSRQHDSSTHASRSLWKNRPTHHRVWAH